MKILVSGSAMLAAFLHGKCTWCFLESQLL